MDTFGPTLSGVTVEQIDATLPDGRRVVGEWLRPGTSATDSHPGQVIYYLHGSGYAVCSARTHRRLAGWMSTLTGLPVFCLDYRLAPRHRFPSAADDTHAGWDWLRTVRGLSPENIVLAGDSAGGHLSLDLLLHHHHVRPAAMVLFSPLVDLTFTLARGRERLRPDPAIRSADAARLVAMYWLGTDFAHPRITFDLTACTHLPPLLVQAGGTEMLAADAHHLAGAWQAAGGDCALQIWPDQVHVFQALPRLTPEAGAAMGQAVDFIKNALSCNTINSIAG
jgi:acetyl esterase/lipase